jgi:hypothetical protein
MQLIGDILDYSQMRRGHIIPQPAAFTFKNTITDLKDLLSFKLGQKKITLDFIA